MGALVPSPISRQRSLSVFPRSVKISGLGSRNPDQVPPVRTEIFQFSENSRRRLRFVALNAFPALVSQFCLTYHHNFPQDGKQLKRALDNFFKDIRRKFKTLGLPFSYLWVLEFQRRGAPHFHLFLPFPPSAEIQYLLSETWLRVSGQSDDPQALAFHNHSNNFISWDMGNGAYLCKYIEKSRQKDVPDSFQNVGRFWGASRGLVPMPLNVGLDDFAAAHDITDDETGECSDAVILAARWLGRWYERKVSKKYRKFRKNFRSMALKTGWTLIDGAAAFQQIERYLNKQSLLHRGRYDELQRKMAVYSIRKARRNSYFFAPETVNETSYFASLDEVPHPADCYN